MEGAASNVGDIPTDTAKTAQTSVATSDSVVPGELEAVAPQEAAEKLSHSLLRGSESVISEVYADEDGAVSVRIGDRPITMDAREAQAMAAYYDGSVDAVDYVTGFHSVYGLAAQGSTLQQIKGGSSFFGAKLTQEQLAGAYNAGHNVYTARQQAATANAAHNAELHARADAERTELELARTRAEALDPASQSFQPGVNRITDGKLSRKQRAQLRVLDAIGKKYGVEIVVDDGLYYDENGEMINSSDANAMFNRETGRIHINLNAVGEAYLAVGMHELVHYVQEYNAEGYSTLETVVLGALEERGEDVNALIRYQMEQFGYSEQLAREEVVANTLPAILNDEAYVKKLVSMDRTLAERIRDFIADFVSFVNETLRTLEGEASWKQMRSIREDTEMLSAIGELFDVALEGVPARRGEASTGGERFSIKYDVNNRPFVVVDEDILDGVPRKEWVKTVKSNLRTKFPNGVTVGENTIYINKTSRKEMTFSKYMQWVLQHDQAAYTDKLRATDNVDEIMRASRNFVDEALLHPRKDDIKQFARGDTLLRVGNNDYTATVIVGTTKSGYMLLYDIINLNPTTIIERNSKKDTATDQRRSEVSRNAVSINNVPQSGTTVKNSIRGEAPENSGEGELFDVALEGVRGNRNAPGMDVKYSIDPGFEAQYDIWASTGRPERTLRVGTTSNVIVELGAKKQNVMMHSADIRHALQHDGITDDIIKQIPTLLEDPTIILKSLLVAPKNKQEASRIIAYGNVYDANGAPVLAVVELKPRAKGGQVLDVQLVKNAYGKNHGIAEQFEKSDVMYLNPDKNRTNSWLQGLGLQLPSDTTRYGSIGSISYDGNYVKLTGIPYAQITQEMVGRRDSGEGELFDAAPEGTSGKRNTSVVNAKYSVNPAFQAQYNAWDGKNANTRFFVGKTSQTLRYVGVKNQEIVWDASKIIKVKQDHPAMSDEIIKRVPSVIENPIIVMESKTVPGRITMFGELADADGAPVLVALELEPTKDYRLNMEVIKIASAYGKDASPQKLLDESLVLFVDPNKNRTQTWLKLYKLQLPSSAKYGLNGRVTYKNNSVNPSIRENVQKNAKDGGGARFSIKYDVNNRPFVVVDEDILKTVPQTKWIDTVKQTLARRFPNGVRVGSDTIKINSQTRREFTYSEYTKWLGRNDKSAYADKFRASSNVDEIILASRGYINEGLKHARKDNIKDFARGGVLLRIGPTDYSADVIVGTTANGDMLLYDIVNLQRTNIQQKRSRNIIQSPLVGNRRSDISAIDNIPQSGTSVNPSIRNSAPENSGEGELFDVALEGTSDLESATKGNKFSFKGYDESTGRGIYESNFPLGTPRSVKGQRILSLIQNVWSKKPIDLVIRENGENRMIQAQFDPTYNEDKKIRNDATKLMGGNRHGTASDQRVTLDLADDYYQIASESAYNYSKDEIGKESSTHKGVKQWHYFINDILFQEQGSAEANPYRVTINVKERSDGHFVYSFSAEAQNKKPSTRQTLHADVSQTGKTDEANARLSINSIRDSGENVKLSAKDTEKGLTGTDIRAVQSIGRKSVNDFDSADIAVTERFARQYWKEMGPKSPFFRAWFGDWRADDRTEVQIANQQGDARGRVENADTGWSINVSGIVFNETRHHNAVSARSAQPYLPYINDIVKKAVLLDSYAMGENKTKSANSLLMHSLYAVADNGNGPEILKLYVEEMNDPNSTNTAKRAYQLQNIEKQQFGAKGSGATPSLVTQTADIKTIADLFAAVKRLDASFNPKDASKAVDENGRPKVFYHGTAAKGLTEFRKMFIGSRYAAADAGFFFTDRQSIANDYTSSEFDSDKHGEVIPAYLNLKNPLVFDSKYAKKNGYGDLFRDNDAIEVWDNYQAAILEEIEEKGADGLLLDDGNSVMAMVLEPTQIKSAANNIGTFDTGNPDIRFSIRDNMTEAERYEELKNAELSVATYDVDASKLTRAEVARLENATRRDARQYVKTLYEKFGINDKRYENPSAKIEFAFSYKGFAKSVHEQAARGNEYGSFGEMLACFDKIVENAIPLEIHTDKYAGTKREDADLQRVHVLVSAFGDNGVVPVQLEVKEFIEKDSSLYVAVTLHKVEDAVLATENVSIETPARAVRISTISLRDLFANINPADGEFLKYVPDGFLNAEQRYAKQEALKKEQRKISNLRFSAKDERSVSIKQQIAAHQDELNKMSPAATIESGIRPRKNGKPDRTLIRKGLQAFYGSLRYSIERKAFGNVSFDEKALGELCNYINSDAEFAAAKAAPAVVKRGIQVDHHVEHKGHSDVESYTFAAPVVLNGKRGNEAVVVQRTNRNKPHCVRILMPDGSGFDLDATERSSPNRSQGVQENSSGQLMQTASFNSISEADENSNLRFSLKDTSPVDVNELRAGNEKLRRALDLAEDQVKLTAGHKVKEGYVGTLAKRILKEYNSSFDYDTFKANLIKVFEYLSHAKNPNMAEVEEMTIGLMKRVIEKSNTFDAAGYEAYAGVRSYLRETGVSLSEDQKLEAAVLSDTYGAYRASLFGSVKLTNDGIALDSAWQEQSGLRPEARGKPVPALTEK